jgi:hypothetical protein
MVGDKLVLVSFFLFQNPIPGTGKSNNVGTHWHSSVNKRCLIRLSCRNQSFSSFLGHRKVSWEGLKVVPGKLASSTIVVPGKSAMVQWVTKGWVCGVTEEDSDWLGSSIGPHTMEVWTGKIRLVMQQGFDLLWVQVTTSTECTKVSRYSLFWEGATNAAGKEHIEALITCED